MRKFVVREALKDLALNKNPILLSSSYFWDPVFLPEKKIESEVFFPSLPPSPSSRANLFSIVEKVKVREWQYSGTQRYVEKVIGGFSFLPNQYR